MIKCTALEAGKLIHSYELDQLSKEDVECFETHLLECDFCSERVERLDRLMKLLTADGDVAKVLADLASEAEQGKSLWHKMKSHLWPTATFVFKPAIAYLFVLLLLYPAYLGLKNANSVRPHSIHSITLTRTRAMTRTVNANEDVLVSFQVSGAWPGEPLQLLVKRENGEIVYENESYAELDEYAVGRILFPAGSLASGTYELSIKRAHGDQEGPHVEFKFTVR